MSRNYGNVNDVVDLEWEFEIDGEMEDDEFVTIQYVYIVMDRQHKKNVQKAGRQKEILNVRPQQPRLKTKNNIVINKWINEL